MRAMIAIIATALWSGTGMAGTTGSDPVTPYVCRPALTWDDLSVTFDRACIKAGGAKRMTGYQTWAYSQLKPDQRYFKPVTNLCDTSPGQPVQTECSK